MRRTLTTVAGTLALVLAAAPASASRVSPGYQTSWGKAGVPLGDYWIDANECGQQAANIDLTGTDPARALVLASRIMDNHFDYESYAQATRIAAPEIQWDRAATIMRNELEKCLIGRGYVKFKLTKSQARHLRNLEEGSLERRMYLHSLASDPAVLAAQALKES